MRLARLLLSLSVVFSAPARAQIDKDPADENPATPQETSLGAIQDAVSTASQSREDRAKTRWTLLASYSYFDSWVPSKWGAALAYNPEASDTYEVGYSRGSVGFDYFRVSIGRVSDDRFYLVWRHFGSFNSLNFLLGLHHESFRIRLGGRYMKSVTGGTSDLLELTTAGPTFGIGNRWQTRGGFVWSFDWLVVHVPVWTLRTRTPFLDASANEESRKEVEDVVKLVRNIPTGSVVKVQLGFAF